MTGHDRLISILWAPQHTVNDSLTLDCTDTWQPTTESDPGVRLSFHWQTNGCSLVARDRASMISRGAEGHIKENNPVCDLLVSSSSTWEQRWVTAKVRREEGLSITPQPQEKLHMEEDMQRTTLRATRGSDHNIIYNKLDLLPSKWSAADLIFSVSCYFWGHDGNHIKRFFLRYIKDIFYRSCSVNSHTTAV